MNPYLQNNMVYDSGRYSDLPTQMTQGNVIWVQGIEGAKGFRIPPRCNAMLLDSENDGVFYIKSTDNVGMATLRIFNFTEVIQNNNPNNYVTRDELETLLTSFLGGVNNDKSVSAVESDGESANDKHSKQ